jgi:hypothetical protein
MEPNPPDVMVADSQDEPLIKASEMARILGMSTRGVRALAEGRLVPFYQAGPHGAYRFRAHEVLRALRREPTPVEERTA